MSKPLSMEDLTVKFHSKRAGRYRGETTIWQAPEGSLYRVVQACVNPAEFEIATLVPTGWITLLALHRETDRVRSQNEAMHRWLDIQNLPATSSSHGVAEHRTEA